MYKISIRHSTLKYFETLPSISQARTLIYFKCLLRFGPTGLWPGMLNFKQEAGFFLFCPRYIYQAHFNDGILLDFDMPTAEHDTLFVKKITYIADDKKISASPDIQKKEQTAYIEKSWIEEQLQTPFIKDAIENTLYTCSVNTSTKMSHVSRYYYQNLEQINRYTKYKGRFGFKLPYSAEDALPELATLHRFDATVKTKKELLPLNQFLKGFESVQLPFVIVNFIDQLDPLSLAQASFMNHLVSYLNCWWKGNNISVVEVIIRNEQGIELYQDEFLSFYKQTPTLWNKVPRPFSMVLYRPYTRPEESVKYFELGTLTRMDFDLFQGCRRDRPDDEKEKKFLTNRDRIIHEVFGAIGRMSKLSHIEVKDYRGKSCEDVEKAINELSAKSIVLRVNGDDDEDYQKVSRICGNLAERGMTNTVLLRADGDREKVMVHANRLFSFTENINDPGGIEAAAEVGYERAILNSLYPVMSVEDLFGNKPFINIPENSSVIHQSNWLEKIIRS